MNEFKEFFKYVYLFVIQVLTFIMMYVKNLEFIGIIIGIIIATVTHIFLIMNIFMSDKKNDLILYFILFSIILFFVSSVFMLKTLTHLQSKYSEKGSLIMLTNENRNWLDTYKRLFITSILTIGILGLSFFTLKKISPLTSPNMNTSLQSNQYESFFQIEEMLTNPDIKSLLIFIIKWVFSSSALFTTSYMVYISNILSKINANQLYIPDTPPPYDKSKFSVGDQFLFSDLYKNLNMNYLTNYIPDVNV